MKPKIEFIEKLGQGAQGPVFRVEYTKGKKTKICALKFGSTEEISKIAKQLRKISRSKRE